MTDQPPNYPPPPPPPPGPPGGYGYPPPPGGYGYPPPQGVGTSGMAIASLVCSLLGLLCAGIGPILGIILGFVALNQIKQTGQGGRGLAIAGIIVGAVLLVFNTLLLILGTVLPSRDHTSHTDRGSGTSVVITTEEQEVSPGLISCL